MCFVQYWLVLWSEVPFASGCQPSMACCVAAAMCGAGSGIALWQGAHKGCAACAYTHIALRRAWPPPCSCGISCPSDSSAMSTTGHACCSVRCTLWGLLTLPNVGTCQRQLSCHTYTCCRFMLQLMTTLAGYHRPHRLEPVRWRQSRDGVSERRVGFLCQPGVGACHAAPVCSKGPTKQSNLMGHAMRDPGPAWRLGQIEGGFSGISWLRPRKTSMSKGIEKPKQTAAEQRQASCQVFFCPTPDLLLVQLTLVSRLLQLCP